MSQRRRKKQLLLLDDFTGSNGTGITSRNSDDVKSYSYFNYVTFGTSMTFQINNNRIRGVPAVSGDGRFAVANVGFSSCLITSKWYLRRITGTNNCQIGIVKLIDASNFINFRYIHMNHLSTFRFTITRCSAGSETDLATFNYTAASDFEENSISIRINGPELFLFQNNNLILRAQDGTHQNATRFGYFGYSDTAINVAGEIDEVRITSL